MLSRISEEDIDKALRKLQLRWKPFDDTPNGIHPQRLALESKADILGYGPLETLLHDDTVTEVLVNGPDHVFIERSGKLEETDIKFRRCVNSSCVSSILAQLGNLHLTAGFFLADFLFIFKLLQSLNKHVIRVFVRN
jgi:Flp pilus assembly CpaF family ATPase